MLIDQVGIGMIDCSTVLQITARMKGSKITAKYKDNVSEATEELSESELGHRDPDYELLITVRATTRTP